MKALIDIPIEINQILNIVKAQFNLRNKAEAITLVVDRYKNEHMDLDLSPGFIKKIKSTENKKGIKFTNISDLRKRYEL